MTAMESSTVLATDNQQKHHTHIWDRDDNTHQAEHDQLFPFSAEQEQKTSDYVNIHDPE